MSGKTAIQSPQSKKSKKSQRKKRSTQRRYKTNKIPMAISVKVPKPSFRITRSKYREQEITIEGEDLIIPTPATLPTGAVPSEVFLVIPANPLYWVGTRVSGIAQVYQQYRPLKFIVEYIPQVPVTCPGQVIVGTLWNNGSPSQTLQQTLMSSNGGNMRQCYQKFASNVICDRKTLPLNYYNVHDDLALNTTNPFYWMAHYSGAWSGSQTPTTNQPGWVYVKWRYAFSVGLGNRGTDVAVYNQLDEPSVRSFLTRHPDLTLSPGWGITLAYLKNLGLKILKKICVVLVQEVNSLADAAGVNEINDMTPIKLFTGSAFTVSPAQFALPVGTDTILQASDGIRYRVSDNTRVVAYMEGEQVNGELFDAYTFSIGEMTFSQNSKVYTPKRADKTDPHEIIFTDGPLDVAIVDVTITEEGNIENINLLYSTGTSGILTIKYYAINNETGEQSTVVIGYELSHVAGATGFSLVYPSGLINDSTFLAWIATLPRTQMQVNPFDDGILPITSNLLISDSIKHFRFLQDLDRMKNKQKPIYLGTKFGNNDNYIY
nr:putative capsid protein [Tombusviridae sp.]